MSKRNTRGAVSVVCAERYVEASWRRTALATAASLFLSAAAVMGCGALLGLNDLKELSDKEGGVAADGGDANGEDGAPDAAADTATEAPLPLAKKENPYGVPYPTQGIGTRVRAANVRGSVIENLLFTGYAPFATSTSRVQLADVYDPQGRTHDIVALLLVARWDVYSNDMTQKLASSLPVRVAILSVLGEGLTPGEASTLSDLAPWRMQVNTPPVWVVLDPSFPHLRPLLDDKKALPGVIVLDARTMEIVSGLVGAPSKPKQDLEAIRDTVKARPPSY